jgi:starch-binding outer membrane protein, SusD/RagB family
LLDQVITDLQQAATLLPTSCDASNLAWVSKNSAKGLLGKVLMYRGTVSKQCESSNACLYFLFQPNREKKRILFL